MNFQKAQMDVLKEAMKRDDWHGKKFDVKYGEDDNNIYICYPWYIEAIPKAFWYLDTKKVFGNKTPFNVSAILADARSSDVARDTGLSKTLDDKRVVEIFTCKNGEELWVNKKFLKNFEFDSDTTFSAYGMKSMLYIYEHGDLVGVVTPIRHW